MSLHVKGQKSQDISVKSIGDNTYNKLDEYLTSSGSAGIYLGGLISDSGSGQIDIAESWGSIRSTDSEVGALYAFHTASVTNVSLTDVSMNYIYIDYNSGVPIYSVTTDYTEINFHTKIIIGRVYRNGTLLNISNVGQHIQDHILKDLYRIQSTRHLEHASGAIISFASGTRQILLTAGIFFSNYDKITSSLFDASGSSRFTYWYRNGSGGWTQVTSQQNIDNLNYDSGTGTLTALGTGDYGVHWVYILSDGSVHVQYGQSTYSNLANARLSTVPSSQPTPATGMGILVGRIIILKNASTILEVSSAFTTTFTSATPTTHNDLSGIQGGISGQYYHLSSADYTVRNLPVVEITGTTQQAVVRTRYVANNSSQVVVTLPASSVIGDFVEVEGFGSGGWKLAQNAGQQILFLSVSTTSGTGGYLSSNNRYDSIHVRCVVANTTWVVVGSVGNITVV